ncbi:MAG: hypothetical protein INR62_02850 [Rhodospirillales bacterium]|nr:hypothetical protein [Acetobacter sp.]
MAAAAEQGEDGIAERALERAAGEAAIGLHVADLGLDRAVAAQPLGKPRHVAAPCAADQLLVLCTPWPW